MEFYESFCEIEVQKNRETSGHNLPSLWLLLPEEYEYFEFPKEKTGIAANAANKLHHEYHCLVLCPIFRDYQIIRLV